MKKLCGKCGHKEEFAFNQSKNCYQTFCKKCNREYQKEHYRNNKADYIEKQRQRRIDWWHWWNEFKATLKCCRCGESHPACLDFHHRDPKEKEVNLATAVNKCWSKKKILEEVEKCDVICSNCHRKLHHSALSSNG